MTEQQAQTALINRFSTSYKVMARNIYFYPWESDLLCINHNNEVTEIEIKCSKFDYLKDAKKVEKHERLSHAKDFSVIPNRFYYAVDEKFVSDIEVPGYAGLMVIIKKGLNYFIDIAKEAPVLHNNSMNPDRWEKLACALFYKIS